MLRRFDEKKENKCFMSCLNKSRNFIMRNNDLEALPLIVLAVYTGFLLNAIDSSQVCPTRGPSSEIVMYKWIKLEAYLFVSNLLGIAVFMFMKSTLSRFHKKV